MTKTSKTNGYSLVEIVLYITILTFMVFIIVSMLVRISGSRARIASAQKITNSSILSLDKMTREIQVASNIVTASSTLGTSPGRLVLTGSESGVSYTAEFSVSSGTLRFIRNGVDQGPLTESGVMVNELIFRRSASSTDQAVSLEMTLESGTTTSYKSEKFYTTAVLRQSL